MKRINRLRYAGVVAGVGLAVVLFGSGAYANSKNGENDAAENTEVENTEVEVIDFSDFGRAADEVEPADSSGFGSVMAESDLTQTDVPQEQAETEASENETVENETAEAVTALGNEEATALAAEGRAKEEPQTYWGYTNLGIAHVDNHLNIRQEPNENGKLVGKLPKDAACEILDIENGWAHIKSGKVEGYCSTDYLYMGSEAVKRGQEVASMIAVVNTETLKVREEPNTDSVVITLIPQEEELEVVEVMDNGWVKFLLDDEEAYVSGDYVDVEERLEKAVTLTELLYGQGVSDVRVDLVQYAKQFVGNPYVWGGVSLTNGADCSGFTLSIYKKYGVSLPHHAASQAQLGTKVSLGEVQPGDLVFYAKNGKINHVAIYIGNGQVIHASSPKTGIKISGVNYRTPACARRYL